MAKVKIILADTNEKYLAPIEMKFLEELDDEIDLEVITEKPYFEEYFLHPRSADILILSEELYSMELQRHDISNIFVLTEQVEENGTDDLRVTKLGKYTSIKEIYNQVVSIGISNISGINTKETSIILFTSASGGTGKTILSLGVAGSLAKSFKKVLYINAEDINSFQYLLNNPTSISGNASQEFKDIGTDVFHKIKHMIRNEQFDYLPPFGVALSSLNISQNIYLELIKSAKMTKEYDAIVVDSNTIFDENKAELIMQADKVIMVCNQTKSSVYAVNMLLKNMSCNDSDKFYFVCNNFREEVENVLLSNQVKPQFHITEYIKHIENIEHMKVNDLEKSTDIQKLSLLVI